MRCLVLGIIAAIGTFAPAVQAQTLQSVLSASVAGDWTLAQRQARALDNSEGGGDFYSAYVSAQQLAFEGRCEEAVFLFDTLTLARPYFAPAYEGAFLCLNALGQRDEAVARLDALLAILPQGAHRDLVFNVRQQVASADRPIVNFFGSLVPSSNANRQTAESSFGAWVIDPSAQGKPGLMASIGASVTARLYRNDRVTISGVGSAALQYNSVSGLLEPRFTLELPTTFQLEGRASAGVTPFLTTTFNDKGISTTRAGINGVVSVPLTETIRTTLSGGLSYGAYTNQAWRDGWTYDFALASQWSATPAWMLTATGKVNVIDTADPTRGTTELAALLRVDHATNWGLLIGLEGELGVRFHEQPPPLSTGDNQLDKFASVKVELSHRDIAIGPFLPQVHYRYTVQDSDNVFYRYHAHDFGLGVRARF